MPRSEYLDGVGLFAIGTASLKLQNLQIMTLSQGTTVPVETSPLEIVQNVGFGDDPDCYFAIFLAYHFASKLWQTDIWQKSALIFWRHNVLAKWYFSKTTLWQNDILAKWSCGKTILWQSNTLAKWYLGKHTGRFPNKHTVQSKRFCKLVHEIAANWMAEEPPIQRSLIFTGKPAARTSWSKRTPKTPRSPNVVLLSLSLIYWCDCAVLFAAPRVVQDWVAFYHHECRDAGTPPCMNMLWSHALPIRVFRVKTVQPSLNLSLFGHENHVSWSFYRLMLRDKRHYLEVLCFEAGSTIIANKHNCPNCCTDTQYQPEKKTRWSPRTRMLTRMLMVQYQNTWLCSDAQYLSAIDYLNSLVHVSLVTSLQCGVESVECGVWSVK